MELSERLKMTAMMVSPCQSIADVGCDHGYMSLYLHDNKLADVIYAMDVNEGPLNRAKINIGLHNAENSIRFILSDGLKNFPKDRSVEACIICGMGGTLGLRILYDSRELVANMKYVYLQLQSDLPLVRYELEKWGFSIEEEKLCIDDNKYYFAIKAKPAVDFKNVFVPYCENKISTWDKEMSREKEELCKLNDEAYKKYFIPNISKMDMPVFESYILREQARIKENLSMANASKNEKTKRVIKLEREFRILSDVI